MTYTVTKVSRFFSRHVSAHTFLISQNLHWLETAWEIENDFIQFVSLKPFYPGKEHEIFHKDFPENFLAGMYCEFEQHLKKWSRRTSLLPLMLAAVTDIPTAFNFLILLKPVLNNTIFSNLYKSSTHLPSFIEEFARNTYTHNVKPRRFFVKHVVDLKKIQW